jgi:hypothetical protein
MMVVWPKHVVAVTSEEEKNICYVDGPLIAELIENMSEEWIVMKMVVVVVAVVVVV